MLAMWHFLFGISNSLISALVISATRAWPRWPPLHSLIGPESVPGRPCRSLTSVAMADASTPLWNNEGNGDGRRSRQSSSSSLCLAQLLSLRRVLLSAPSRQVLSLSLKFCSHTAQEYRNTSVSLSPRYSRAIPRAIPHGAATVVFVFVPVVHLVCPFGRRA